MVEKGQAEASLCAPSSQLVLEKEKLGAMQAHLAGKMAPTKAPASVSHPRPTGGWRGAAGTSPHTHALRLWAPVPSSKRAQAWKPVPSDYKPSDPKIPKHHDLGFSKQRQIAKHLLDTDPVPLVGLAIRHAGTSAQENHGAPVSNDPHRAGNKRQGPV